LLRPLLALVLAVSACDDAPAPLPAADADDVFRRASGVSLLVGTAVPGDRMRFEVAARPGDAAVELVVGRGVRSRGIACVGAGPQVCTTLQRPSVVASVALAADGSAAIAVDPPTSLRVGEVWWVQAVVSGTRRVSPPEALVVSAPLEVAGAWTDVFGGQRDLSSFTWYDYGTHDVLRFDNANRVAFARNGADTFAPGRYSRFDWAEVGGERWICQSAYDAPTLADAAATPAADATDPAAGGCGLGFPWTRLDPAPLALAGTYTDAFGTLHTIDDTTWDDGFGVYRITRHSNARRFVIAQNDVGNPFHPGLWSRFDWHEDGGDRWYCQSAFAERSEAAAAYDLGVRPGTSLSDPSSPDVCGCGAPCPGGFAWTLLTP
jgi:hypothetical protein